ncbi:hypothetical protein TSAR_001161, partial [Trichomalopsis sarcophagae]
ESEEEVVPDKSGMEEIKAIKAWVIDTNIPYQTVDKLLLILKKRLLPQIPNNTQMLLKWDCNNFDNVDNAEVSDRPMGIQKALNNPNNDASNIDIIKMETINCKTDFAFFVTKSLTAIARYVADIKAKQDAMSASMAKKYQYYYPVTSLERFLEFDKVLENNKFLRFDVFVKPNLLGTKIEFRNRFDNPIVNGQLDNSTAKDLKLVKRELTFFTGTARAVFTTKARPILNVPKDHVLANVILKFKNYICQFFEHDSLLENKEEEELDEDERKQAWFEY